MINLDFSDLQSQGYNIHQLRLLYSPHLKGNKFMKLKKSFTDKEDLTGERNLILEYVTEKMEICYTLYLLFAGLMILSAFILLLSVLVPNTSSTIAIVSAVSIFVCWFIANRNKGDFAMASVGYGLVESLYNVKIKEKYNL
jgi:hypothetical protein